MLHPRAAAGLTARPGFVESVWRWLRDDGDDAAGASLRERLDLLASQQGYEVALLHLDGRVTRLSGGSEMVVNETSARQWQAGHRAALASGEVQRSFRVLAQP